MTAPESTPARYSIARRLFYSHLLIALLIALLTSLYFYLSTQNELARAQRGILTQAAAGLADRLNAVALDLLAESGDRNRPEFSQFQQLLQASVSRDVRLKHMEVLRLGSDGRSAQRVVSSEPAVSPGEPGNLSAAQLSGFSQARTEVRITAWGRVDQAWSVAPLPSGGGRYIVLVQPDPTALEDVLDSLRRNAGLAFILAVALALAASQWLARAARRVISAFVKFCGELAEGRFDRRLDLTGDEEFVRLGTACNDMASRLKQTLGEREAALAQARIARDQLEANVRDRTRELERLNVLLRGEAEQRSRLEAALAEAAATDPLTKLLNRRGMLELIQHMVERLRKQARFFCLLVIDVDHFKRINDHYGHSMGDQVLAALAGLLKAELKSDEAAARWGGEEFLLLWPDIGLTAAEHRANRIRELIASKPPSAGGPVVTISIGIAEFTGLESVDTCLIKADRALYRAKDEGRNRVVVSV